MGPPPLLPCERASTGADVAAIPAAARAILSSRYRSWEIAAACKEVAQTLAVNKATTTPSVVVGDFDNDGARDYAVMLKRRSASVSPTDFIIVALLVRGNTFLDHFAGSPGEFMCLVAKGSRDYNYDTGTYFTHAADGIYTGILEKSGWVSIYRNGKFIVVYTVD